RAADPDRLVRPAERRADRRGGRRLGGGLLRARERTFLQGLAGRRLCAVERGAERTRQHLALYLSAMGTSERNFQYELFVRMGYEAEANRVRTLWNEGRKAEAAAAVTMPMVDAIALVGPKARIRDGLAKWKESFVTTL